VALLIGAAIAVAVHARQKKINWRRVGSVLGTPLETGGIIILTVSAGAAYGEMIKHTGLSDQVRELAGAHAINYVVLAWGLAVVLRAAQGSATVAMITGTAITASVAGPAGFGVHPIYILLAAGYGSKCLSWMNDAGFWIISRVSGITPGEALRSWTILGSSVSVVGLIEVWLVSMIWPHLPF
jgi:GntP family gluconate:H+ symporter